jgi:hypothetical protein
MALRHRRHIGSNFRLLLGGNPDIRHWLAPAGSDVVDPLRHRMDRNPAAQQVLPRRLAGFELPRVEYAIFDQPASALHSANARSPTLRYPVAAIPNAR